MASQGVVGLRGGFIVKGDVNLVQNLIFDFEVGFLCIGDTRPDLMLLGVVADTIVSSIA